MNLLSRAKLTGRIRLSSICSISSLQQSSSYSTSRTAKAASPKSPKSPAQSSSLSERIKRPTGDAIEWPKPREIPYQAKVANFVNLIGYVKAPVQFETDSDGKHFVATAISQDSVGRSDHLLIPVVFEGDLAHVVASHVKENDCVLVSGQLSSEPLRFAFKDVLGKLHVVAENLNYVEGFYKSRVSKKKSEGVKNEMAANGGIENVVEGVDAEFDQRWNEALEDAKEKFSGEKSWGSISVSPDSGVGFNGTMSGSGEAKMEKVSLEIGQSGVKKNDKERVMDLWRDLAKNSLLWWDYRDQKAKGLVKDKFPDFKHKETGDALWISSAPLWVLPGLEKLEFDIPVIGQRFTQGGQGGGERKNKGSDEDSWKDLVENPSKWWDNRKDKRNPKGPDFKQKETGKGLWLDASPDWAVSKLPPLK